MNDLSTDAILAEFNVSEGERFQGDYTNKGEDAAAEQQTDAGSGEKPQQNGQQPSADMFELELDGKKVQASKENLLKWAQERYDLQKKLENIKQQQTQFDLEKKSIEDLRTKYTPYEEVDKFIKDNPQWWAMVEQQYQKAQQDAENTGINNELLKPVMSELQTLKQFREEIQTERENLKKLNEDRQLDTEIQSVRKQYSNLNWDEVNASGKTLEQQIIDYAIEKNIPSFSTAFRDKFFDQLTSMKSAQAKEQAAKEIHEQKVKQGIVGKTAEPTKVPNEKKIAKMSWNDLAQQAMRDVGL